MWLVFLILFLICSICIFIYYSLKKRDDKEHFVEMEIHEGGDNHNDESYKPNQYALQCSKSVIIPNDVHFTNIINLMKNQTEYDFIGVASDLKEYLVITPIQNQISTINEIEPGSKIYYDTQSSLAVFHQFLKIYRKSHNIFSYEKISDDDQEEYINNFCDSYDINHNPFIDFIKTDDNTNPTYFIVGFNQKYNLNLKEYFNSFFKGKRLKILTLVDTDKVDKHIITTFKYSFFNGELIENNTVLLMDELVCSKNIKEVNYTKLLHNKVIDFKRTQLYLDVYNCNIPNEIEENLKVNKMITNTSTQNQTSTNVKNNNSCDPNYNNNEQGTYVNHRCLYENIFVDINFPFAFDYDIKLSQMDFNELIIKGSTFDNLIPINNIVSKKNTSLPRYKINVDPINHPKEKFIDDIYYGIDIHKTDDYEHTILTNSVPFEFDDNLHEVHIVNMENGDQTYYIKSKGNADIMATYTSNHTNEKINAQLLEGDRVYMIPTFINDEKLLAYLVNEIKLNSKNFYHGTVKKTTEIMQDNEIYNSLVIELYNLRKTNEITGSCFDKNWDNTVDDMVKIKTKEQCESNPENKWDIPCKYNYECPFFQKNKNYKNFFGGCMDNGRCEMPVGIVNKAYRRYEVNNKDSYPVCYNCPNGVNEHDCCDLQEKESSLKTFNLANPNLVSSDYMFEFDTLNRHDQLFNKTCDKNSLKINKYI